MRQDFIRQEFNRWAEQGRGRGMRQSHWEITRQMIETMNVGKFDNVIDLGCGVGWAARLMAERAPSGVVVGVDLSDRMIGQAIHEYRNPANLFFAVADALALPCRDAFFNSLLSVESIYYYPNLDGPFSEAFRVMKPGGRAHFLINYYKENVYSHGWAKHIEMPLQLLSGDEYCGLLAKAGFTASHRRIIDSTPIPEDWTPSRWFPTRQDQVRFQAEGALLVTALKA